MLLGKMNQVTLKVSSEDVTGRMGLSWVRHCMKQFGVEKIIDRLSPRESGSNREIAASRKVMAGAMSLIAGAERIEDIEVLRQDRGLLNSLGWERMISPDTLREYLQEKRNGGKMRKSNEALALKAMAASSEQEFTYDIDATYFDSQKDSATYSYQMRKQYSGLLGFIAELKVCSTVDFRAGHVQACNGILNQLRKAIRQAKSVSKRIAVVRSDSAGHSNKIFRLCDEENIRYFISLKKNEAVMAAVGAIKENRWQELKSAEVELGRKVWWAETVYVTNEYVAVRMLVLRWTNPDRDLFEQTPYCYHAIGTNDNAIEPMAWLKKHNLRMSSENENKELKSGFNAAYAPSHDFNMDRGYFLLNVLAYNMVQVMKLFYLGAESKRWTVKTLRYHFIQVCGKIVRTGRRYFCKIINAPPASFKLFRHCLARLVVV